LKLNKTANICSPSILLALLVFLSSQTNEAKKKSRRKVGDTSRTSVFVVDPKKALYGKAIKASKSFGKFGVPNPVTGSHPTTASKPLVPQPGLEPIVMSLKAEGLA